ncbi:hypothetical protein J2787_002290 [Chryseobacterium rhizosphaerae]|uniref:Cell wall anchor protein n=1 Tax=Chryseobacterium rhizosphaerae TaxID=395937 RepID=A0AAE4C4Q5_9FLAO|nr:hypothetical protein [Chryseobacterium rhizosphaerae]MDR6526910.1 hypothetical protein [Chryseobacterium rhizosphaerae]
MKKTFLAAFLIAATCLSAQQPATFSAVTIESYSPILFLKRANDYGGYIQGVQSQLLDGSNNWFYGNIGTDLWTVGKGDYQNRQLTVSSSGNVAIGTSDYPQYRLQVNDGMITSKIADANVSSTNKVGYLINELGGDVFEVSFARDNQGTVNMKTFLDRPLVIGTNNTERMRIAANGNVGIGSKNPDAPLTVKGLIHAEEIKVDLNVPADYVFQKYYTGASSLKPEYTIPTLEDVEKFTKENNHLPNIPSAKEIQEKGLNVGEMSNLLLQKIEELTLYTIEQNKLIKEQQKRIEALEQAKK